MLISKNALFYLENPSRSAKKTIDYESWMAYANGQIQLAHFRGHDAIQIPAPTYIENARDAVSILKDFGYRSELVDGDTQIYIEIR